MINLRYHIVSLAAVFLAFGLGILAGTTVIDTGLVKQLRQNTIALERDLNSLRTNASDLQRQLGVWESFGRSIVPPLLQGRLAGRSVVVLADAKVPGALLTQLSETLLFANAKRPTRITFTKKWSLETQLLVDDLAAALRAGPSSKDAVLAESAARLGARLAGSSDPRAANDFIQALDAGGFLDIADLPGAGSFPPANAIIVVVSSGDATEAPSPEGFFIPLLQALSPSRIVAVAEPTTAVLSLAELVRGDRTMSRSVCTVDHVDTVAGRLSLVYGLHDLTTGKAAEHFGVRGGARSVAPDLRAA